MLTLFAGNICLTYLQSWNQSPVCLQKEQPVEQAVQKRMLIKLSSTIKALTLPGGKGHQGCPLEKTDDTSPNQKSPSKVQNKYPKLRISIPTVHCESTTFAVNPVQTDFSCDGDTTLYWHVAGMLQRNVHVMR
jgi:hypothetical protein